MQGEGQTAGGGRQAAGAAGKPPAAQHRRPGAVNIGRRSVAHNARRAVTAGLRLARDSLATASIRVKGVVAPKGEAPSNLVAAWRVLAAAEAGALPDAAVMDGLCAHTMAAWGRLPLSEKIALLDAWAAAQLQHGGAFALPRPLLRALQKSMWADGGRATASQLSTAALRAAPFLKTPAADLARGILDAAVHWAAELVAADSKAASALGAVLSLAPQASRTDATQRELQQLRLAASQSKIPEQVLEEAIYQRVSWMKSHLRCDSVTARSRVAASLARDSLEHGGDIRTTFIKAFGHAPEAAIDEEEEEEEGDEPEQGEGQAASGAGAGGNADTREALRQWERSASERLRMEAAAAEAREAAEIQAATLRAVAARADAAQLAAARAAAERAAAWQAGAARAAAAAEIQPAGYSTPPARPGHTLSTVLAASPPS